MAVTAANIEELFRSIGANPEWGMADTDTSVEARYQRIADEINAGTRDIYGVAQSIDWIAQQEGGAMNWVPKPPTLPVPAPSTWTPTPFEREIPPAVTPKWLEETPLGDVWQDAWIESGDGTYAIEMVRNDSRYDQYFAGNRREDGSLRYDENTYFSVIESYDATLRELGLNTELFKSRYAQLVEYEVSPNEFIARTNNVYQRVLISGENIRQWYANNYNLDMSFEGIMASIIDPEVGDAVLNRRITMAEIGGEAANRNYDITSSFVEMLAEQGMDRDEANSLFGTAERLLPVLQNLALRHGDTDSTFDITEFASGVATGIADAEQIGRMERLVQQERASFTGLYDYTNNSLGGAAGLVRR